MGCHPNPIDFHIKHFQDAKKNCTTNQIVKSCQSNPMEFHHFLSQIVTILGGPTAGQCDSTDHTGRLLVV